MGVKAVIFDFDGVIVESVGVKKAAFRQLFLDYPHQLDTIVDYHMEQGGLSRYKKFEYIYRHILKEPLSEERLNALGRTYTDLSHEKVVQSSFVAGAKNFMDKYSESLLLFIASGTPQEEMDRVVAEMHLGKYFKEVYGSPTTKTDIAAKILKDYALSAEEAVFVGDAINDYEGARNTGIPFIGRIHASYESPFKSLNLDHEVADLTSLEHILCEINV